MGIIGSSMISGWSGGQVSNPILIPDGSVDAPALASKSYPNKGVYFPSQYEMNFSINGVYTGQWNNQGLVVGPGSNPFLFLGTIGDLILQRDAANTLALKNGNAEQQLNIYSGNGAYGAIISKQELVTTTAAATAVTVGNCIIPDGAVLLSLSTYVQTAITTGGLTGYNIGDGLDADRWGAITGHTVGTKSNNSDWTATTIQAFTAAQAITLTAVGANFPAGGKIRVCMTYMLSSEPTS